ncbi:MAG: cupin domain-containing protein [Halobacteria archaeon]|nr:cupin domain-containing protein [Halobacteria archaeon]
MKKIRIQDVDNRLGPGKERRWLSDELGAEDVSVNYYVLEPGESFGYGLHKHENQEEVFYIQSGTATFETEEGETEVEEGEVVRFAPGEYQLGKNEGDENVVALAMGAPREMGETEILRECDDCGERTVQELEMTDERDAILTKCTDCGSETGRFD